MSDDLVTDLRTGIYTCEDVLVLRDRAANRIEQLEERFDRVCDQFLQAADRIEKLEKALREMAAGYETEWSTSTFTNMMDVAQILSERINIARKALEGKDE